MLCLRAIRNFYYVNMNLIGKGPAQIVEKVIVLLNDLHLTLP